MTTGKFVEMSLSSKKIYFHVGLPKTGTSTLQEELFPLTSFLYLGKSNLNYQMMIDSKDPFLFVKFLQGIGDNSVFSQIKLSSLLDQMYGECLAKVGSAQNVLISDEGFTLQPLKNHFFQWILPILFKKQPPRSIDQCFEFGVQIADHTANQILFSDSANGIKRNLIVRESIAVKIQRCLDAFDASLGKILIVDRDYGSWITSFYLQCYKGAGKFAPYSLAGDFWSISSLLMIAGFIWHWDNCLVKSKNPGFATAQGFCKSLTNNYGSNAVCCVQYSSDSRLYANSLSTVLQDFGFAASDVIDKVLNKRVNLSRKKKFDNACISEVMANKDNIARHINSIVSAFD